MALRLVTPNVNTNRPGSYVSTRVRSTPSGIGSTGIVAIIGEADAGEVFSNENLKDNFFSPDQVSQVVAKYGSGPIVDAMGIIATPSNDPDITGGANQVYILKTNSGTKAQATVDTNYGTIRANNHGVAGNQLAYKILASSNEAAPTRTSALVPSLGAALDGLSFSVRVNGDAATVVTLSNTATDHDTIAELAAEIDTQLPAGITCAPGTGDTLVFAVDADAANFRKGWGKSFELIDSTPGDLAAIGLSAALTVSGQESAVEVTIVNQNTNQEEILAAAGDIALRVGYLGTTATLTISTAGVLTTTVVGGAGSNLNINTKNYTTVKALADFINAQTGYSAEVEPTATQLPTSVLDKVSAIGIATSIASNKPGRVKRSMQNFKNALATSQFVEFVATDADGLPTPISTLQFLSGGAKGATTAANVVDAIAKLEALNVNFVVPLFSRDASLDIADGLTDAGSTYTIDAVHAAVRTHVLKMSQVKLKKNRSAILSYKGTFNEAKTKAASLASFRAALAIQDVQQGDTVYQPWYLAALAAGMQSGGFYKAIFNKLLNVTSIIDPTGFDSGSPGDVEEALEASLLVAERLSSGVAFVSDQTTYGFDTNFVYNSVQAVYALDIVALNLAQALQTKFVGKSLADVEAGGIVSEITAQMVVFKRLKLIAGSDDAELGYRNVVVRIEGPTVFVSLEIKLATAIYFIPIELEVSQVTQSASI